LDANGLERQVERDKGLESRRCRVGLTGEIEGALPRCARGGNNCDVTNHAARITRKNTSPGHSGCYPTSENPDVGHPAFSQRIGLAPAIPALMLAASLNGNLDAQNVQTDSESSATI